MKKSMLSLLLLVPCAVYAMEEAEVVFSWAQADDSDLPSIMRWGASLYTPMLEGSPDALELAGSTGHSLGYMQAKRQANDPDWQFALMKVKDTVVGFLALELLAHRPDGVGIHVTPIEAKYKTLPIIAKLTAFIEERYPDRPEAYTTVRKGVPALKAFVEAMHFKPCPDYKPNPELIWTNPDNYEGFVKNISKAAEDDA